MLLDCQQISGRIYLTMFSKPHVFQLLKKLMKNYYKITQILQRYVNHLNGHKLFSKNYYRFIIFKNEISVKK